MTIRTTARAFACLAFALTLLGLGSAVQAQDVIKLRIASGHPPANTYANLTPLVTAGFCYLIITLPLGILVRRLEAKAARAR